MLTLTENATTAVKDLAANLPADTGGLRISEAADPQAGYALSLADGPERGDTVVENDGARVYVDPAATVQLDDRVLDAQIGLALLVEEDRRAAVEQAQYVGHVLHKTRLRGKNADGHNW